MNNQKGATNLISTMAYLLISFAILAMVTTSAMDLLSKSKEQANYETMLDTFEKINLVLKDSISNKQEIDLKINNPEELEIDCTNNKIIGKITYKGNYKTEETIIADVLTYKKGDYVYFEKDITNLGNITLNCKDKLLPKGKITLTINYFEYDSSTKTISLDISHNTKDHNVSWYNSNWAYRKKITIDHNKVEEDLVNFPLLIKIRPTSISEYTPNYYIEDDGTNLHLWTKINLAPRETKILLISKEEGFLPNGEEVFDFFDDFKGTELSSKWTSGDGATLVFSEETLRINTGAITLSQPFDFNLQNNFIITIRSKTINHTTTYGGVTPGVSSSSYSYSGNSNGDSKITMMKSINNTDFYVYAGSGSTTTHDIVSTKISTINLDEYNIFDVIIKQNSFEILKDKSTIYSSPIVNFTKNINHIFLGYYDGSSGNIGDTEYDYIYIRKYLETEPTIAITNDGENYLVKITNNSSEEITDYQIKLPGTTLDIISKSESINITQEELTEEQIQATLDLADAKSDGSGLVFTSSDGKTKLKREIESITSEGVLPYYIEETGGQRFVWTKIDLEPNETKQIIVNKTDDDYPDGDSVFDFYDDFHGDTVNTNKWTVSSTYYSSTGTSLKLRKGAITLTNPLSFNLVNNYIVKIRSKQLQSNGAYGGALPSICSSNFYAGGNGTSQSLIAPQKYTGTNYNIYLYAGSGSAASYNIASGTLITTFNNNEYNVFETILKGSTFEIYKNNTNIYTSSTVTFTKELKYLTLGYGAGTDTYDISDTEYDYLFVRKYITTEPTITTTKVGDQFVITITNNLSETLTDYQIKIPAEDLEVYSKFRSLEIIDQSFSPNNNSLAAWIKVPKLSSTEDTVLYMYYGNPNAEEENDSDVWNTDYLLVQHLNETPTNEVGGFLDSTDNSNDGIPAGFDNSETSTTNVDGKINGGVLFGEGDNKINIENSSELNNLNKLTISAWINPDFEVSSVTKQLFIKEIDDSNYIYSLFINDGNLEFGISDGLTIQKISSEEIIRDSWQFVTGVYDGNNLKLYINGENVKTEEITPAIIGETDLSIIIGNNLDYSEDYVGYLDEIRMSNIDKSSAWIKTEYNNQSNPYDFYTFGLKENQ